MAPVSFDEALAVIRERLAEKSADHCVRVSATAADLAATYGVEVELARLAGLLHDWDRDLPRRELVEAAIAGGLGVTSTDEAAPYPLHALTGAKGAADAFPELPVEVSQAIARHTIGAPDMTPLDQIVYLADMVEPARDYPGVAELRASVGVVSLSELFALGYQHSVLHLVLKRRPIHPETVEVWNSLVAGEPR